jgi:cell division protease FtsH
MKQSSKNKKKKEKDTKYFSHHQSPWTTLIWIVLIWLIVSSLFGHYQNMQRVKIPYSTFKQQLRDNHIQEVTITGQKITGEFKEHYHPPEEDTKTEPRSYKGFSTIKPVFEDPDLIQLLDENDVTVEAKMEEGSWFIYALINLLPWLLIIGFFVYTSKKASQQMQSSGGGKGLFGIGRSRAKRFRATKSKMTFQDIAGMENAKNDLIEIVQYMKNPKKFIQLGADIPRGILLMGPPGCGKTLLAKGAAGEADIPFFSISGSEFIEMFVGVGASRVRDMFLNAKKSAPSIIFIDEIDAIGRTRGAGVGGGHDEREQTLNQILSEMDGFETNQAVTVIAATNRPDVLDPALTRPGRFDRHVTVEFPQQKTRKAILHIHVKNVPLSDDVDLKNIAARTVGFSGADLKNLANEAALLAGRKNKNKVSMEDFDNARDKILLGSEREEILTDPEKKMVAFHESGHALAAYSLPHTDPLQKVTIIPRGKALGATEQIPEIDRHNYNQSYLRDLIAVRLGGRAAEKVVFNEVSNGSASDLKQVTQIARKMVCQWGMSDLLGPVTFRSGEEHVFLGREMTQSKDFSDHTARQIDEEIQKIVHSAETRVMKLLNQNQKNLHALAETLLEKETLDKTEIEKILNRDQ